MKRVFISYCHEDGDFADVLRSKLEAAALPTWTDSDLRGGQMWRAEIDLAIREALALVVVGSPESMHSDYVAYEWSFALGAGVNVVPILLRLSSDALHPALQARQCIDFTRREARPWDLLFRAIKGAGSPLAPATIYIPPSAPPVLEQAARSLDSMDEDERKAALRTLAAMSHPDVPEILAGAVKHPIEEVRLEAANMLLAYGDARALPGAFESLRKGQRPSFKKFTSDSWPLFLSALQDPYESVRAIAVAVLGNLQNRAAIPHIQPLLQDPAEWVRRCAVIALGKFRDPELLPFFEQAFRAANGAESDALEAASTLPDFAGVPLLLEAFHGPALELRRKAINILRELAPPAGLEPLCRALNDTSIQTRAEVAHALGSYRQPAAVSALFSVLEDHPYVCDNAFRSLSNIGGPLVIEGALRSLEDFTHLSRADLARLLANIGDETVVPRLAPLLDNEPDPVVRRALLRGLAKIARPGSPAARHILPLLNDPIPDVALAAAEALRDIGDPAAVQHLQQLMESTTNAELQSLASDALAAIGTPEARQALVSWARKNRAPLS